MSKILDIEKAKKKEEENKMKIEEAKKNMEEAKKKLEKEMITGIIEYLKNGTEPHNTPESYMNSHTIVYNMADKGEEHCDQLLDYHNKVIERFIEFCYKDISQESNILLIDTFIKNTEKINFLIYWMKRIFTYLDKHYSTNKMNKSLSKISMKLYKAKFFVPLEK